MKTQYTFENILNGKHGNGLKAVALSAVNFELSRLIANHPTVKMPTEKVDSPDALRDLITLPELEGREQGQKLDALIDGLVATCALIKDLASSSDYDSAGRITRPYAYLIDRAITPQGAIERNFAWRADMSAKVATEQAQLLGIKDAETIGDKARQRSMEQNSERIAYALAEVNSHTNLNLMQEDEVNLLDLLNDLNQQTFNGLALIQASAQSELRRAKRRIEQGLYTKVDEEVILFAKTALPE